MKRQIIRKRTCRAFLVMVLMATAIPCASLGEIKITASRDYVDKKVAAVSNALDRAIANQSDDMNGKVSAISNALEHVISNSTATVDSLVEEIGNKADKTKLVIDAKTGATNTVTVAYTDDVASAVSAATQGKQDALSPVQMKAVNSGITAGILITISDRLNSIEDSLDTNNFKTNQTAVVDPTADGNATSFIATIEQDENGKITATKKTIPNATTNTAGIVQLSSETTSTDDSKAATLKAVSEVRAIAVAKQDPATTLGGYGITDAKIVNGTVMLGTASITPLTAESDLTTSMGTSVDSKITSATNAAVKTVMDEADTKVPLANIKVNDTALTNETVVELGNAYIILTTEGEGATAKKRAVLYAR